MLKQRIRLALLGLVLATLTALAASDVLFAQVPRTGTGEVVDEQGLPVMGARLLDSTGKVLAISDAAGEFAIPASGDEVEVEAPGFVTAAVTLNSELPLRVVLKPAARSESITITAYRYPMSSMDSPASTRILTNTELTEAASTVLDDKLRQVPGAELFRRSSSLVANPTSQGISLRGLGSTAASRTLVLSNDISMLDPYGGWIHWEELPELSIQSVEIVRGGASDLYGSSAIGGVINFIPVRPTGNQIEFLSSYGSLNTIDEALLGSFRSRKWSGLASGGLLRTDGYILTAPDERGKVDVPSNVHAQNGVVEIGRDFLSTGHAFLRGNVLNEARGNGTVIQTNGTRLWRYSTGADWTASSGGTLVARLFGDNENYRQTFSSVSANRNFEALTRYGWTPAAELGAAAHFSQPLGSKLVLLAGADTHDVRATDYETNFKSNQPSGFLDTSARQRQTGIYGEALWSPGPWTISAGARIDFFSNFDAIQWMSPPLTQIHFPDFSQTPFDPRLGISHRIKPDFSLNATAFRAFRAPTENELYRTGQVGQEITKPNPLLRAERATGWETGFEVAIPRYKSTLRTSYFWTQVNRPITALTISTTPTQIIDIRVNLGQIESRGVTIDGETAPTSWLSLIGGYQFANATVTKFAPQPSLVGNWIPQVAHNTGTLQARFTQSRLGVLSLQGRVSGQQYDNATNTFLLHGYFRLDAYASHNFGQRFEVFASGENLFDRAIEVGKTPTLTLGTPIVGRVGVRIKIAE